MSLLEDLCSPRLLEKSWKTIYSGKTEERRAHSKGIDGISLKEFKETESDILKHISNAIKGNKYKLSKLRGYAEPKEEKNKFRLISVATISDRIVHKAVLSIIHPHLFEYINTGVSYCGVKGNIWNKKSNSDTLNTRRAIEKVIEHLKKENFHVFKSDIKKFYDNIPKRRLSNTIVRLMNQNIRDNSLDVLLKGIVFFHLGNPEDFLTENKISLLPNKYIGISQGSPLSQFFANVYLADFDRKMKSRYGDRFIRYIDDFIVLCGSKQEARESEKYSQKLLSKIGLTLSDDKNKTYYVDIRTRPLKFLGLQLDKNRITSKKNGEETRKWILKILDANDHEYRNDKKLSDKVSHMNNRISGYANYLRFYHAEDVIDTINKQITHKRNTSENEYKKLEVLKKDIIKPIIKNEDWKNLF